MDICAQKTVLGRYETDPKQRNWTFELKTASGGSFHYISAMKIGAVDREGLCLELYRHTKALMKRFEEKNTS